MSGRLLKMFSNIFLPLNVSRDRWCNVKVVADVVRNHTLGFNYSTAFQKESEKKINESTLYSFGCLQDESYFSFL